MTPELEILNISSVPLVNDITDQLSWSSIPISVEGILLFFLANVIKLMTFRLIFPNIKDAPLHSVIIVTKINLDPPKTEGAIWLIVDR